MPTLSTTQLPGALRTTTSGVPSSGAGLGSLQALAEEMMRLKLENMKRAQQQALVAARPTYGRGGGRSSGAATGAGRGALGDPTNLEREKQKLALRDMQNQIRAKEMAPPTRMVTGAGVVMGATPDVDRFNAYDRANYLPNESEQLIPGQRRP